MPSLMNYIDEVTTQKKDSGLVKNSLHDILSNSRYMGTYTFNRVKRSHDGTRNSHSTNDQVIKIENGIPSIISEAKFMRAQEKMAVNKKRAAAYKAKETYLLSGLIQCACGAAMLGKTTSARGVKYCYYRCGSQERRTGECKVKTVFADALEDAVIAEIDQGLFAPGKAERLENEIAAAYASRSTAANTERTILETERTEVARKMDNLYCRIEDGVADDYDMERLRGVKDRMTQIKSRLTELAIQSQHTLTAAQVRQVIESYRAQH